ncbi:MAG: hypothetical protein Satyrvirus8_31 [Satyrvirus sp.]|uniref:Uncharacterized protein n=1 Tax=Satyrvirus sp. TaxID=2487771 RepID=A0A3G5AHC1_9VIRU|nr:MAG: hypothetical protein Satyrvirus8_31 [Satyrvirus sp.]
MVEHKHRVMIFVDKIICSYEKSEGSSPFIYWTGDCEGTMALESDTQFIEDILSCMREKGFVISFSTTLQCNKCDNKCSFKLHSGFVINLRDIC